MGKDIFISYASEDRQVAGTVCAMLESKGIECWIAPRDILPGTPYAEALIHAIDASKIMVLIFSSHANTSPHILREAERAVHNNLTIIPFHIDDSKPSDALLYYISAPHWLDASDPPFEKHLDLLVRTINAHLLKTTQDTIPSGARRLAPHSSITHEKQESKTSSKKPVLQRIRNAQKIVPITIIFGLIVCIAILFMVAQPNPSPANLTNMTSVTNMSVSQTIYYSNSSAITTNPTFVPTMSSEIQPVNLISAVASQTQGDICGSPSVDIIQGNKICINGILDSVKAESIIIRVGICNADCCNGGRVGLQGDQFSISSDGTHNQEFTHLLNINTNTLPSSTMLCMRTGIPGSMEHQQYNFEIVPKN
jgi:TIR domain